MGHYSLTSFSQVHFNHTKGFKVLLYVEYTQSKYSLKRESLYP